MPHNSFQMRSGYMNWALLTCVPRTGKIIGTIGSCMDFDACENKNSTIFVHISQFQHLWAVFFETSYFIFTFSFLDKWLIISLLEKKLSGLPSQFQLSQLFLRGLCVFIFSIFIILYIYYNYIYIKQLYNNIVKKKEQKRKLEPLLKITETTETETLFSPQSASSPRLLVSFPLPFHEHLSGEDGF